MRVWKKRQQITREAYILRRLFRRFVALGFVLGSLATIAAIGAYRLLKAFGY